ncbi:hypothetical protein SOVF_190910, partial [Spinacia oleracea]
LFHRKFKVFRKHEFHLLLISRSIFRANEFTLLCRFHEVVPGHCAT